MRLDCMPLRFLIRVLKPGIATHLPVVFLLFFLPLNAWTQSKNTSSDQIDSVLYLLSEIKKSMEAGSPAEPVKEATSGRLIELKKQDSMLNLKEDTLKKLKQRESEIDVNINDLRKRKNRLEEIQQKILEGDIVAALNKGASNDSSFLAHLKIRADKIKPASLVKLGELIALTDSVNALRRVFESAYDPQAVQAVKNRLKGIRSRAAKSQTTNFMEDLQLLEEKLTNYCEHTQKVYQVVKRHLSPEKPDGLKTEMEKAYYYVRDYVFLKNLFDEARKDNKNIENLKEKYNNFNVPDCKN